MAYYSTFIFQLHGCPEIHMSTRYNCIQDFDRLLGGKGKGHFFKPPRRMVTIPREDEQYSRVTLNKFQRRKIQTFLKVIFRKGIHRIPRRWRKFVKNDGVFPQEILDRM